VGVRPLELIVHHSINTERSIPAKGSVHNAPLGDSLIMVVDDSVLPAPVLVLKLGLAPDVSLDPDEFPENSRPS